MVMSLSLQAMPAMSRWAIFTSSWMKRWRNCAAVIEPAAGVTRSAFAFLLDAYHEEEVRGEKRVVLKLHPRLAPIKVAVLPLSKKPDLVGVTHEVADLLRAHWNIEVDVTQSIGRRYRRQDDGGGEKPAAAMRKFVELAGGQGRGAGG